MSASVKNRNLLTFAVVMSAVVISTSSASAAPVAATGWNADFILGSG